MKTALVYDRVNKWGGAERVLLALHELFPDASLYTSVYDRKNAAWADKLNIKTSFLQNIPYAKSHHELIPFLMPIAFEQFNFDEYDLVISITSEAAKGIITKPHTLHICYCLTPTRYLWSGYDEYFKNPLFKYVSSPIVSYLKSWDKIAASHPDIFISISNEVKKRIKKYYELDSEVIYPPVLLEENKQDFLPCHSREGGNPAPSRHLSPYFLVVSRLVPYKKIELAIQACNALSFPLKIIGTGKEESNLKKIAGPTIKFLDNVTDKELTRVYKNCQALIFPGIEDFGLTIIEAQKYGKPVIAYKAGGALETIKEGKTGLFFDHQNKDSLINALQKFGKYRFSDQDCKDQAANFNFKNFKNKFLSLVEKVI
jgi:glycosyltransferase involved in cell wall biosynthesis